MDVDDMILVSVDDHVIEPAHMFEGRVPKKYEDRAPRFVRRGDGTMAWRYERATVAALREQAADWDVSAKSVKHLRPETATTAGAF